MTDDPAPATITRARRLLHGGDYNPEQWLHDPHVLREDIRLMQLAGVTNVSVGIFSWAMLEPEEGRFDFGWLDEVMDRLAAAGIDANLATPSGAKPNWLALKYPQVRRVDEHGHRDPQRGRHNHCYTSPIYREKVTIINTQLAERYGGHPALALWHVSNEYGGVCHCDLCWDAFRAWLRARYADIDALNRAWWTTFWSHRYRGFDEVTALDGGVHGLTLDWRRFVTHQTVGFLRHEAAPLRRLTPHVPITTNTMGFYDGLDPWRVTEACDFMAWDAYPGWHAEESLRHTAVGTAFVCDLYRSLRGGRPWLLMESTPSNTNWAAVAPLKRPGVHRLASMLTVAHGSDGVLYFQWRKSRGSAEKFHGAVVDHVGHEHTRVFREVAALGGDLARLGDVCGGTTEAQVALLHDWENRWAINAEQGPNNQRKRYNETCVEDWYAPLCRQSVPVDVLNLEQPLDRYRLVLAPMLYMLRAGVAERLTRFVEGGGTLVTTYLTGLVDEHDLCFLGGFPGPLRKLLGVWAEELDALPHAAKRRVAASPGNELGLGGDYEACDYFELLHAEGAAVAATYGDDFFAGRPAVTVNHVGRGRAIHVASRNDGRFHHDLLGGLVRSLGLRRDWATDLPEGVVARRRRAAGAEFVFVLNFSERAQQVPVDAAGYHDALRGGAVGPVLHLDPHGVAVLRAGVARMA